MTIPAQIVPGLAKFAVSGFTRAAPGSSDGEALRDRRDIGYGNSPSAAAVSALKSHSRCRTAEIRNDSERDLASQSQAYATALKAAYARIDVSQNPALAALAANLAQLAVRAPTR